MDIPSRDIVEGLGDLWQGEILCDITLQTEGERIVAHRAVLAASSPYFRAMFDGNFKEAKDDVVTLDKLGIPFEGLSVVIKSLYTLKLDITKENCDLVTMAAILLQFTKIQPLCEEFIQNNLDYKNCVQILQFCETFSLGNLKEKVDTFILRNFTFVSQENSEFAEINKDCLLEYMLDDDMCVNEADLYRAVMTWIKFNPTRIDYLTELLGHIRFYHIPLDIIKDEIAKEPLLENSGKCSRWLKEAIYYHLHPYKQPFLQTISPRGELSMLMHNTTDQNIPFSMRTFFLDDFYPEDSHKVANVNPNPLPGLDWRSEVIPFSVENFVFLLYSAETDAKWCHARYDPVSDTWLDLAPPPFEEGYPKRFMSAKLSKSLFICGGSLYNTGEENKKGSSSCLVYSIEQNIWEQTSNLPDPLCNGLSCVHNECIYITSFLIEKTDVQKWEDPQLLMYDSNKRLWQEKAPPPHCHIDGFFETVNDKLFIGGGCNNINGDIGEYHMNAEVYDTKTNQWTDLLTHFPNLDIELLCKIEHVRSVVVDKVIYCFGNIDVDPENDHEDDDNFVKFENLNWIFDTDTGEVSHNFFWEISVMDEMDLVTVPINRFKPQ